MQYMQSPRYSFDREPAAEEEYTEETNPSNSSFGDDFSRALAVVSNAGAESIRANPRTMPMQGRRDPYQAFLAGVLSGIGTFYYGVPGAGIGGIAGAMSYDALRDAVNKVLLPALNAGRKRG